MNDISVSRPDPWTEITTSTGNIAGLETKVTMKKEEGFARTVPKKFVHPKNNLPSKGFNKKAFDDGYDKIDWSDNEILLKAQISINLSDVG